jgi:hypothetical protein
MTTPATPLLMRNGSAFTKPRLNPAHEHPALAAAADPSIMVMGIR